MITYFSGKTADEVWLKVAQNLLDGKNSHDKSGRTGNTRELLHACFSIADPRQRWVFSRVPPINVAFALAEIIWIMNGRDDARFLTYWNSQLPKYVGNKEHLHGAYGFRLHKHMKINQLERAYKALKSNPDSRQIVLQIWDSQIDLPNSSGMPADDDIPCNIVSLIKIIDTKLEWFQIMRSNDIQLGTPYNFVQFTYLQEIMAGWLGLELGSYNHLSDSIHVYLNNIKDVQKAKGTRYVENNDIISLPYRDSKECFLELSRRLDNIQKSYPSEKKLRIIAKWSDVPIEFRNILFVLIAEAARKLKYYELSEESIDQCINPALKFLWTQWSNRFHRKP